MPKLGFGMMRLPVDGDIMTGVVDVPQVCEMVDAYMKRGFNYFDTAYMYHGGKSEEVAREVLVKRYARDSFYLADKMPVWMLKSKEDRDRYFNTQLERVGVDYFDFYLLHDIEDGSNYENAVAYDCFEWGKQKKAAGEIKQFGFSFHGKPELLEKVLAERPEIDFVQIQLNYADWDSPVVQSGRLYEIMRKYNKPIIVMEPVRGGMLANLAPDIAKMMTDLRPTATPASWALRFVGSLEGVVTILSGMSNKEHVEDNLNTFTNFEPLRDAEHKVLKDVVAAMATIPTIPCTDCRYCCDGCPAEIQIPEVFKAVNALRMYGEDLRPHLFYARIPGGRAKDCSGCGQCEDVCPQHLGVMELIKEASSKLDVAGNK